MARVFLAFALPEKVRDRLKEEADRLRLSQGRVIWTRPSEYHATVHFFGEIDDQTILDLDGPLAELFLRIPPLALVLKGLRSFPLEDPRPRVLWSGIYDEDEAKAPLQKLWGEIQDLVSALGLKRERPPFQPHVTIGRVKADEGAEDLLERMQHARRREFAHFRVAELTLFETIRLKEGPVHTPLRRFALRGRPTPSA